MGDCVAMSHLLVGALFVLGACAPVAAGTDANPGHAAGSLNDAASGSSGDNGSGSGAAAGAQMDGPAGDDGSTGSGDASIPGADEGTGGPSLTDGGSSDGGLEGEGDACAFVDEGWLSGLIACPDPSSSGLCTISYLFGSNGCYSFHVCATDIQNTSCHDDTGHWSQTSCGAFTVTLCDGTTSVVTIQGPGADGRLTINGDSYSTRGPGSPMDCSCAKDASAGDGGGGVNDAGSGLSNFLGASWRGSEAKSVGCGEAGSDTATQSVSGSFQQTASGLSFTDQGGCTWMLAASGNTATLAPTPQTCTQATDAAAVLFTARAGEFTTADGHRMTGQLQGTVTLGTTVCSLDVALSLSR